MPNGRLVRCNSHSNIGPLTRVKIWQAMIFYDSCQKWQVSSRFRRSHRSLRDQTITVIIATDLPLYIIPLSRACFYTEIFRTVLSKMSEAVKSDIWWRHRFRCSAPGSICTTGVGSVCKSSIRESHRPDICTITQIVFELEAEMHRIILHSVHLFISWIPHPLS